MDWVKTGKRDFSKCIISHSIDVYCKGCKHTKPLNSRLKW